MSLAAPVALAPAETARPAGMARTAIQAADRVLRRIVEAVAAGIVLAEIGILFAGVVARFVLNAPLIWSDELASILFLWLAMLGAVLAVQRGSHMRLTSVLGLVPAGVQPVLQALAICAPALFLLLLLPPALDYAQEQAFIQSPALGWPDSIRTAALPVGCVLMVLGCLVQMARHRLRHLLMAAAVLAVLAALAWARAPALEAMGRWNLVVFFVGLLATSVLAGVPSASRSVWRRSPISPPSPPRRSPSWSAAWTRA